MLFFTTLLTISSAKSKLSKSLLPSPFLTTFGAGQPILISTISAKFDTYFALYAIVSGSLPKICIDIGLFSPCVSNNSFVLSSL